MLHPISGYLATSLRQGKSEKFDPDCKSKPVSFENYSRPSPGKIFSRCDDEIPYFFYIFQIYDMFPNDIAYKNPNGKPSLTIICKYLTSSIPKKLLPTKNSMTLCYISVKQMNK